MSFLDSIKHAGSNLIHSGEDALKSAQNVASNVVNKAEDVGSNVVHKAEEIGANVVHDAATVGTNIVHGAEKVEHAAVSALKFEGRAIKFGLDKAFDGAKKIGANIVHGAENVAHGAEKVGSAVVHGAEKAGSVVAKTAAKGVDIITHPGLSHPPGAQGLKFSETKGAAGLAYSAKQGEVYKFPDGKRWEVVDVKDDPKTGFRAVALKPLDTSDKRMIVAYAGTSGSLTGPDWKTDFGQAAGLSTGQYKEAVDFANKWKAVAGNNLILTGHSLGGGLASYASIKTGLRATAVNAAPLAVNHLGLNPAAGNRITQYYVPGEALSVENKLNQGDFRPGAQIPVRGKDSILDPRSIGSNHSLDHVAPDVKAPEKEPKS